MRLSSKCKWDKIHMMVYIIADDCWIGGKVPGEKGGDK